MPKTRAEKTKYVREWRATQREKRRFDTLLSDYTNVKYPKIYKEATEFYRSLNKKYHKKHDLTKCKEYRRWKSRATDDLEIDDEQISSCEDNEGETTSIATASCEDNEGETTSIATASCEDNEGETTSIATASCEDNEGETPSIATASCEDNEGETPSIATASCEDNEGETPSIATTSFEDNEGETTSIATASCEDNRAEMVLTAGEPAQNLLQLAAADLIPDSPGLSNEIDNIIDEIIRDLRRDPDIRDLVDDELNYEDEGIGLNPDNEPLEYVLEMEEVDW